MIYPSIDKLLTKVGSKYLLVHIASRRAKEMTENKHNVTFVIKLNREKIYEDLFRKLGE